MIAIAELQKLFMKTSWDSFGTVCLPFRTSVINCLICIQSVGWKHNQSLSPMWDAYKFKNYNPDETKLWGNQDAQLHCQWSGLSQGNEEVPDVRA